MLLILTFNSTLLPAGKSGIDTKQPCYMYPKLRSLKVKKRVNYTSQNLSSIEAYTITNTIPEISVMQL